MFQTQIVGWLTDRPEPRDERDRFHRIAIADARVATEFRVARPERRIRTQHATVGLVSSPGLVADCCAA